MIACTLVHQRPGGQPVELTTVQSGLTFDTAAVGGFGSLEVTLPGDQRRKLAYLGMIRAFYGTVLLWEGQLEDQTISYDGQSNTTTARAFGLQRKLSETSLRRVWSKRDLAWQVPPIGDGGNLVAGAGTITKASTSTTTAIGSFDPTNLARQGIQLLGNAIAIPVSSGMGVEWLPPIGTTIVSLLGTATVAGPNVGVGNKMQGYIASSADGATWTNASILTATGSFTATLVANAARVRLLWFANTGGPVTPTSADSLAFESMRMLGTSLTEDVSGGYYGGTILRDLVALVSGLTLGQIDDGSDYTIQAIERAVRDASLSVVQEVAGYYTREWAVWEDGRFDWKTRNLDEAQWIVMVADTTSLEIDVSTDPIARTVYVLYTDAASGLDAEASAVATDPRNPYVRQAITKDLLVTPGFPMTSNTSGQLASRIAGDVGARPSASGRVVLPANRLISSAVGPSKPAALIRGGDNILLPELPKTDAFLQGRDGETLFHVAASSVDLDANTVTLELEGQQQRTDVILARLAAATRVLTG